ncbi:MAG: AEC family transporter [Chitinophagaceae bacterium]|nr:AEC family transporter [Chitinophagaceae bacterium]
MANFLLIGICLLAGVLVRRFTSLPSDAHKGVNSFIIHLALPAVSFKYLPHIQWTTALLIPALMPVALWLCAWLYIRLYAGVTAIDKKTENGLKLTTGLSNTSFIGFPMVTAYFGEHALGIAVICDQVSFLLLSTAGIVLALNASDDHQMSASLVAKKVLRFPPFIACVLALTVPHFADISLLDPLFDKLAATIGPLALFSTGLQLKFDGWLKEVKHISMALLYKLVLAPLLIVGILFLIQAKGLIAQVTAFESAMPSFLTAGVIASEYGLNPRLSNLVVGFSILLAFITSAVWYMLIIHLL